MGTAGPLHILATAEVLAARRAFAVVCSKCWRGSTICSKALVLALQHSSMVPDQQTKDNTAKGRSRQSCLVRAVGTKYWDLTAEQPTPQLAGRIVVTSRTY